MRLHAVYARFYRSLNYDFVRASADSYTPDPWDTTPAGPYPFVRIKLRPDITTIVGANESGKSQVLNAIDAALTGARIDRSDFCRYSRFFATSKEMTLPEFGVTFSDVTDGDVSQIATAAGMSKVRNVQRVAFFRMNEEPKLRLYLRQGDIWTDAIPMPDPGALHSAGMPEPFRINSDIGLPASVPIEFLATGATNVASVGGRRLRKLFETVFGNRDWFTDNTTVTNNAASIVTTFRDMRGPTDEEIESYQRASDLLIKIAGLDQSLFTELQRAVEAKNAYATSIVDIINGELAKALDFPHWWSQDSQFELFVDRLEFDLIFMIRDRTGRTYGFDERSEGLKYFLSYFVQYLAHEPRSDGAQEILLMDEPDRYLSSAGQQDLLRIFEDFADPKDRNRTAVQVVYVTHSPFLIDKNVADRIRVLDKGEYDEGTRVIASAAANHYEPLRSAFGSFVAETTFIGNCNLVVEGPSDQVLLAGTARWLRERGVPARERVDLNHVTIVPAGGTRHVPYLVYLARGRDVEKPPVVVLLDHDRDGDDARAALASGGAYGDTLIDQNFVLQLGVGELNGLTTDNPLGVASIEDLIPLGIAIEAARVYCNEFVPSIDPTKLGLTASAVFPQGSDQSSAPKNRGLIKHLESAIISASGTTKFHLDKIAFARATVDVLTGHHGGSPASAADLNMAHANFALLNKVTASRQRASERAERRELISSRVNRIKRDFTRTHKEAEVRVEDVLSLIEDIEAQLDLTPESEDVRQEMRGWHERFNLTGDQRAPVEHYQGILGAIASLAYKAVRKAEPASAPPSAPTKKAAPRNTAPRKRATAKRPAKKRAAAAATNPPGNDGQASVGSPASP